MLGPKGPNTGATAKSFLDMKPTSLIFTTPISPPWFKFWFGPLLSEKRSILPSAVLPLYSRPQWLSCPALPQLRCHHASAHPFFWNMVSCSPGWPPSSYVVEDDLEFLILLPLLRECWNYRHALQHPVSVGLGIEPRALRMGNTQATVQCPQPYKVWSWLLDLGLCFERRICSVLIYVTMLLPKNPYLNMPQG